jgi:recombination protein RecR
VSSVLPVALQKAMDALGTLPGVGSRSAERYVYYLLKATPDKSHRIVEALEDLHGQIKSCPKTFALIDASKDVSPLYDDPNRDKTVVAVVEDPFDIAALERTGQFKGTYHVLGGLISPIDNIGPEKLHINELLKRVKEDKVKEIIMATNASVEGESTALYIAQQLAGTKAKITRLARGLPIGLDLEYADQITLSRALEGRQSI